MIIPVITDIKAVTINMEGINMPEMVTSSVVIMVKIIRMDISRRGDSTMMERRQHQHLLLRKENNHLLYASNAEGRDTSVQTARCRPKHVIIVEEKVT